MDSIVASKFAAYLWQMCDKALCNKESHASTDIHDHNGTDQTTPGRDDVVQVFQARQVHVQQQRQVIMRRISGLGTVVKREQQKPAIKRLRKLPSWLKTTLFRNAPLLQRRKNFMVLLLQHAHQPTPYCKFL